MHIMRWHDSRKESATVLDRVTQSTFESGKPTFYEFFAGGGMARAGLEPDWKCLFANDLDTKKHAAYVDNWGASEFRLGDVHDLSANDLPGKADLAWASFPCQDLSLAGNGRGLDGSRSSAFWGFHDVVHALKVRGRAPSILVLENVGGAVTSKNGQDFENVCRALKGLGYIFGGLMLDAVHFVPQSRPRLFIVAMKSATASRARDFFGSESDIWSTPALRRSVDRFRPDLRKAWRWWTLPIPRQRETKLSDIILESFDDVSWHSSDETGRILSMMSDINRAKVELAQRQKRRVVGTIYRRTRIDEKGRKTQRAEVRFDETAGCLRTPLGGSSRQTVIAVEGKRIRSRLLSAREAARLMGLPDTYKLPDRYNDAYHLLGDGLVVPAIKYLSQHLLLPMIRDVKTSSRLMAAE